MLCKYFSAVLKTLLLPTFFCFKIQFHSGYCEYNELCPRQTQHTIQSSLVSSVTDNSHNQGAETLRIVQDTEHVEWCSCNAVYVSSGFLAKVFLIDVNKFSARIQTGATPVIQTDEDNQHKQQKRQKIIGVVGTEYLETRSFGFKLLSRLYYMPEVQLIFSC